MNNNVNKKTTELWAFLLLCFSLVCTFIVYIPGLSGPFLFDDISNLEPLNRNGGVSSLSDVLAFVFGNESGSLGRPVSMLSFLLNDNAWPGESFSYKYTNVMIHLINGLLLFYLSFRLIMTQVDSRRTALLLALFVSSAWMSNPFNVSTVLYTVQRMAQLSMLFALLAMIFYLVGRLRIQRNESGGFFYVSCVAPLCCFLAMFSKENGVLAFLLIICLEFIFFRGSVRSRSWIKTYRLLYLAPFVAFCSYLVFSFDRLSAGYRFRDFSMTERLLTQPRVVLDYVEQTLGLRSIGRGLFHDDFVVSSSLVQPLSTAIAIVVIISIFSGCLLLRKKAPLVAFGGLFFLAAHSLESTFIPLEMYFEHRNYLPMCGIFIAISGLLLAISKLSLPVYRFFFVLLSLFYVPGGLAVTHQSAGLWGNDFDLYTMWATEHPKSLRAQRHYGGFLGRTEFWSYEAMDVLQDAYLLHPSSVSLPITMLVLECRYGSKSGVTIADIEGRLHNNEENGAVMIALTALSKEYFYKGCEVGASESDIAELLWTAAHDSSLRAKYASHVMYILVEYYKENRDLNRTILTLEALSKLDSSYGPELQKGYYLYTAGLYDEALIAVKEAYVRDANRKKPYLYPSSKSSIEKLEMLIMTETRKKTSVNNNDY